LHAAFIALVGPLSGYSWEISAAALFREGTVMHTVLEGFIVALFAALEALSAPGERFRPRRWRWG
jgi:hypothetical protein